MVSNIAKNPKSFWRYVNTSLKTRPDIDAIKCIDGSLASFDQEKAHLLNSYFSSVFTREDLSNIPNFKVNEDIPLLDNISISSSMVWREINKLKSEKSAGPDGWPIQVLKQCSQQISLPFSILFNKSFQSGHLPCDWKIAYITPIHKKGLRNVAGNYRPVSLTSTVVKLMKSIIKSSIFNHLISNNLISSSQFGFLPGHSCSTQLLYVMDIITSSLDHGLPVDVIYLDLQKAFDSVPHNRLLLKVESYGISGKFLGWIKSFLSDREQFVVLNGCKSGRHKVLSGVPQGSILGPLLFTIYVNDLPQSISSSVFMFADDTKLIRPI